MKIHGSLGNSVLRHSSESVDSFAPQTVSFSEGVKNYHAEESARQFFLDLLERNIIDSKVLLDLELLDHQLPLDKADFQPILEMLIQERKINIWDKSQGKTVEVSFSWIALFQYLKENIEGIKTIEFFGSKLPYFLPHMANKVAQILMKDLNYQLDSEILKEFKGNPADTDYLIPLECNSLEEFVQCKNIIVEFIAKKAHAASPTTTLENMKQYVEQSAFYKCNVPTVAHADMFALFSFKEAGSDEISELVISQRRNEFAFRQDDLSLSLPIQQIVEAFPTLLSENSQMLPAECEQLLIKEKEQWLQQVDQGAFTLPTLESKENNVWLVFLDLLKNNLSLPKNASERQDRLFRLMQKYSIGKCSEDCSVEEKALQYLRHIAEFWPGNKYTLPYHLQKKLEGGDCESVYANRIAAIASYLIERHFIREDAEFDGLISTLWHTTTFLQEHGYEQAIVPLWKNTQASIDRLSKSVSNQPPSLWTVIAETMCTSPEKFTVLRDCLQANAFLSLYGQPTAKLFGSLDTSLITHQQKKSFKICEGKYSLRVPAHFKVSVPDSAAPLPSGLEHLTVPSINYTDLISCLISQITEKSPLHWKLIALDGLKACSVHHPMPHIWNIIESNMLCLLDQIEDQAQAVELIKKALEFHLPDTNDLSEFFPEDTKKVSPQVIWANILMKLASNENLDRAVTQAYHLWNRYREKDVSKRDFSFEWEIVKEIASKKPHLRIPVFYSLEEGGYQNIEEHKGVVLWLLEIFKKGGQANQELMSTAGLEEGESNAIDPLFVRYGSEKISQLDVSMISHLYKLALKAKEFSLVEKILLDLIKNKNINSVLLIELLTSYLGAENRITVPSINYTDLISWLISQITEKSPLHWQWIALDGLKACFVHHPMPHIWNIIESNMLCLLDQIEDQAQAVELIKKALEFHLPDTKDLSEFFPEDTKKVSPQVIWANILIKLASKENLDRAVTQAYHLWSRYRKKDVSKRDFSFEWEMVKEIASKKQHLRIPVFYSLEEGGYQNIEEHKGVVLWLLEIFKKGGQANQELAQIFGTIIPIDSQKAFFDVALQELSREENINEGFNFLFSLKELMSTADLEEGESNAIDQLFVRYGSKKVDQLDFSSISHLCKLAHSQKNDVLNLLENSGVEKILLQFPTQSMDLLLRMMQSTDPKEAFIPLERTLLRLYFKCCHISKAKKSDYKACFHSFETILSDSQKAFFDVALQELSREENISEDFNFFFSLKELMSTESLEEGEPNPIDQLFVRYGSEKISQLDVSMISHLCKLAVKVKEFSLAEKILLDLIKNKNIDSVLLIELLTSYLGAENRKDSLFKFLDLPVVEKILMQSPKKFMDALRCIMQLSDPQEPFIPLEGSVLRLYLKCCQGLPVKECDYPACFPLVEKCLKEGTRRSNALKQTLQDSRNNLLEAAMMQSEKIYPSQFSSLFFGFLKINFTKGFSETHLREILNLLQLFPKNRQLIEEILNCQKDLMAILPSTLDASALKNLSTDHARGILFEYIKNPNQKALKALCNKLERQGLEVLEPSKAFLSDVVNQETVLKVLEDIAQHIYENRSHLKKSDKLKTSVKLWNFLKKNLYESFSKLHIKDYSYYDLLMQGIGGKHSEFLYSLECFSKSLFESDNFIGLGKNIECQLNAVNAMTASNCSEYFKTLTANLSVKMACSQDQSIYEQFLSQFAQQLSLEHKMQLCRAFKDLGDQMAMTCGLIVAQEMFKTTIPKEKKEDCALLVQRLVLDAYKTYPKCRPYVHEFLKIGIQNQEVEGIFLLVAYLFLSLEYIPEEVIEYISECMKLKEEEKVVLLKTLFHNLFGISVNEHIKHPVTLIRFIKVFSYFLKKLEARGETESASRDLFSWIEELFFLRVEDSAFEGANCDVFAEYINEIKKLASHPPFLKTLRSRDMYIVGAGELSNPNYEKSAQIEQTIDMFFAQAHRMPDFTGYMTFRMISQLLKGAFKYYSYIEYLNEIKILMMISCKYASADKKHFFNEMVDIILDLICIKKDLTPHETRLQKFAAYEWSVHLGAIDDYVPQQTWDKIFERVSISTEEIKKMNLILNQRKK